jgi:hypothetical protein
MKVLIGVDPHKASVAVAAMDELGELIECASFPQNRAGLRALERWAKRFPERRWAVDAEPIMPAFRGTPVRRADLGERSVVYGALALARRAPEPSDEAASPTRQSARTPGGQSLASSQGPGRLRPVFEELGIGGLAVAYQGRSSADCTCQTG